MMRLKSVSTISLIVTIAGIALALAVAVLLAGCARRPPALTARTGLMRAERAANQESYPPTKLKLQADVGIAWLHLDPAHGRGILRHVHDKALTRTNTGGRDLRCYELSRSAIALAGADRPQAVPILLKSLLEVTSIDPRSRERFVVLAALAHHSPDEALKAARRLPDGDAKIALANAAAVIAQADLKRAIGALQEALAGKLPCAPFADEWWLAIGLEGASEQPQTAIAVANQRVKPGKGREQLLLQAYSSLATSDQRAAERALLEEKDPVLRAWARIEVCRAAVQGRRGAAVAQAAQAIRDEQAHGVDTFIIRWHWCLLAVVAESGTAAREYLDLASAPRPRAPTDAELGVIMTAASFIDRPQAMAIYRRLARNAKSSKRAQQVLQDITPVLAWLDADEAIQAETNSSEATLQPDSLVMNLPILAMNAVHAGARQNAVKLMAAAEKAMTERLSSEAEVNADATMKPAIEDATAQALGSIAAGFVAIGETRKAFHAIERIREPEFACREYLALAELLSQPRIEKINAFMQVNRVAGWMRQALPPAQASYVPKRWTPLRPPGVLTPPNEYGW